jgi:hypothetical protein
MVEVFSAGWMAAVMKGIGQMIKPITEVVI